MCCRLPGRADHSHSRNFVTISIPPIFGMWMSHSTTVKLRCCRSSRALAPSRAVVTSRFSFCSMRASCSRMESMSSTSSTVGSSTALSSGTEPTLWPMESEGLAEGVPTLGPGDVGEPTSPLLPSSPFSPTMSSTARRFLVKLACLRSSPALSLCPNTKKVSCWPLPFTSMSPLRSNLNCALPSSMMSYVERLICTRPGRLVLSMRLAWFTVSPNSCHRGLSARMTPVTMGPELMPTRTLNSSFSKILRIWGMFSMTCRANVHMATAWLSTLTLGSCPQMAWYPSPMVSTLYTPRLSAMSSRIWKYAERHSMTRLGGVSAHHAVKPTTSHMSTETEACASAMSPMSLFSCSTTCGGKTLFSVPASWLMLSFMVHMRVSCEAIALLRCGSSADGYSPSRMASCAWSSSTRLPMTWSAPSRTAWSAA
mmetsp:Transcript_8865/g.30869  ORF Transcript_8865/g.30869 Transcript_8865/m.30869 type:complete len:425 (+) Transcript_8865:670-1944(+)